MKKALTAALAVALIAAASISAPAHANNEVYLGVGSTGVGVGYGYGISDQFTVRGEYDWLNYDTTYNHESTAYSGDLKLQSLGAYGDWHPFKNDFRLTVGIVDSGTKLTGSAQGSGTVTINHVGYSLSGQSASLAVKFPSSMPYLGIGYGHQAVKPGWNAYGDLGLQFGNPRTSYNLSTGLAAMVPASDVQAQIASINHDARVLGGYPVMTVGVSYVF